MSPGTVFILMCLFTYVQSGGSGFLHFNVMKQLSITVFRTLVSQDANEPNDSGKNPNDARQVPLAITTRNIDSAEVKIDVRVNQYHQPSDEG